MHPDYVEADAERDETLRPCYFVYTENQHVFYHAFHLQKIKGTIYADIQSPYGYGGAISTTKNVDFLNESWKSYGQWCEENNILVEFIRFHPLLKNQEIYIGKTIKDRQTIWVDLENKRWDTEYRTLTKRKIKKAAAKNIQVNEVKGSEFISIFPELYKSLMIELQADEFYLFPENYYERLCSLHDIACFIVEEEGRVLAVAIFLIRGNTVEYHLGASTPYGKQQGAMYVLMDTVARAMTERGFSQLYLGGGTNSSPDNPLLFFKSGFSKRMSPFYIGYQVFFPDVYDALKREWEEKRNKEANRILFYRF